MPKAVIITGTISYSDGSSASNLIGTFSNPLGGSGYAVTDSNGGFSFSPVGAGSMSITLDNIYDGYQVDVPGCLKLQTTFTSDADSSLKIALPPSTTVSVTVVNPDGTPVIGAEIYGTSGPSMDSSFQICPTSPALITGVGSVDTACVTEGNANYHTELKIHDRHCD
jgi:hypothetical protein